MRYLFTLMGLFLALPIFAAPGTQGWTLVGNTMQDERWAPAAAVLPDGRSALIVGGFSYTAGGCVATADRFDEQTSRFHHCAGRLSYPRDFATATVVSGGQVLIAGGYNTVLGTLNTVELYDPARDTFHLLPSRLSSGRELFTATLLADGRVLLVGGFDTHRHQTQSSADLFDAASQTFSPTQSPLAQDRFGHAAVRLADGRVLIVGGTHWRVGQPGVTLASAEIFDPATGRFHRTAGDMSVPRDRPTATLLPTGQVLVAGGQNTAGCVPFSELFDPISERFTPLAAPLIVSRMAHSDVRLPDGRVLLAGGWSSPLKATTPTTELYDPHLSTFSAGPSLPEGGHDLALLAFSDGTVLAAGGKQVQNGKEGSLSVGAVWLARTAPSETPYLSQ